MQAERLFTLSDSTLAATERRHNTYLWRTLQLDQRQRDAESVYETLARAGYGGKGTMLCEYTHYDGAKAAKRRMDLGEEASMNASDQKKRCLLQPIARDRYFIEHEIGTNGEFHI